MIIATAGHVDHGKTSLVRNITGVETDRLEEEQRRGLSISLGYAYWRPDDDTTVGFIDVPGHRRFINNMISGVSGIDLGLLVVAADDGPMPQTREHVHVMDLLGVDRYLLVITKCDRVDDDRVSEVSAAAAALLPAGTPVHTVSNTTKDGIDELSETIAGLARETQVRKTGGNFRMSIDRSFHLQGRGLVVTGTIASGSVTTGDTLLLQPQGVGLRVRGIHVQDQPAPTGTAGNRCAINVSGDVHKDIIERGDWLASENSIGTTARFDTRIRLLPDAPFPLKHLSEVKLHLGAKYLEARLVLLGSESPSRISPGEALFAQFITERPILCCRGDRFLLRDFGETATLGGGIVLDPHGSEKRKSASDRLAFLSAMENDDIEDAILASLEDEQRILDYDALLRIWNLGVDLRPGRLLRGITRIKTINGERWLANSRWDELQRQVSDTLSEFHRETPDETGIEPAQLAELALHVTEGRLFESIIDELSASGAIRIENGLIALADFKVGGKGDDDPAWLALSACLARHGLQIPNVAQLEQECDLAKDVLTDALNRGQRDGRLVRIKPDRYAETSAVNKYARAVLALTENGEKLTVAACRDHLGCGRNILIDMLEYFDSIGFTRRIGNARIVLDRGLPENRFAA